MYEYIQLPTSFCTKHQLLKINIVLFPKSIRESLSTNQRIVILNFGKYFRVLKIWKPSNWSSHVHQIRNMRILYSIWKSVLSHAYSNQRENHQQWDRFEFETISNLLDIKSRNKAWLLKSVIQFLKSWFDYFGYFCCYVSGLYNLSRTESRDWVFMNHKGRSNILISFFVTWNSATFCNFSDKDINQKNMISWIREYKIACYKIKIIFEFDFQMNEFLQFYPSWVNCVLLITRMKCNYHLRRTYSLQTRLFYY